MPYEIGGRADKNGNQFEIRWVIYQLLEVLNEKIDYVILEALGDDEQGVDIWIGNKDGTREGQQCKGRNGSQEYWDYGTVNRKSIFINWAFQLNSSDRNRVALVSPLAFTLLKDIVSRAKTNDNPKDFYDNQIKKSGKELQNFFMNICKVWNINPDEEEGLIKAISYFKRISYRQCPDAELKELILSKINLLLVGNEEDIYEAFVAWIIDGDNLGKKIDIHTIHTFLKEKEIRCRNLATDDRIAPAIRELNRQYRDVFIPLKSGMIERQVFSDCREAIKSGKSIIIHGRAGRGKSGCTADVISYCEEKNIPYIAIKLDMRIPKGNAESWGNELGLPASIPHCIHSISKNRNAVIILDQLDALRWTHAHSREAMLVCDQLINQVEELNIERDYKISIVLACRTYDLENDNHIKGLVSEKTKKGEKFWRRIKIDEIEEETVKKLIGKRFDSLTKGLKELLKIPSNLYIWQELDPSQEYDCNTTLQLITDWWQQLKRECFRCGILEKDIEEIKDRLVAFAEGQGKIYTPISILKASQSGLDFLSSSGFLVVDNKYVSFAHQSILDCFLAENMLVAYLAGKQIEKIIGTKDEQTPSRRYQVQMFLQNLLESNSSDFLEVGQAMLENAEIRYLVKSVFFELLNQITNVDENIARFIVRHYEDEKYGDQIINNVIFARPEYIRLLRRKGILDRWMSNEKKEIAIKLVVSMGPNYEKEDVEFIKKHIFISKVDIELFSRCFSYDINTDSDDFFELRMELYEKYPLLVPDYLDVKDAFKNCELRAIHILEFLLRQKKGNSGNSIYKFEEEFLPGEVELFIENGKVILDILLSCLPKKIDTTIVFSVWSKKYNDITTLERACVQIIKKANINFIKEDAGAFWELYSDYLATGNDVYNEIILEALYDLSEQYSDKVVSYLCSNPNACLFEKTSGKKNALSSAKVVIEKHSKSCGDNIFRILEETILEYFDPRINEFYKRRMEHRKNHGLITNWSFWGDLQIELLRILPGERMSQKSKELLCVLERKFANEANRYNNLSSGHFGTVMSPVSGKKLSDKQWLGIITNNKLESRRKNRTSKWVKVPEGFIESSLETFSASFSNAVSKEPERMLTFFVSQNDRISDIYVNSLLSRVAYSDDLNEIPLELLEQMMLKYPYDYVSNRASYICTIIEKKKNGHWSQNILNILQDIAINHEDPSHMQDEDEDIERLYSNALNCVRGSAAFAIASLLEENSVLYGQFKDTIEKLTFDANPAVRFASLDALKSSYDIDAEWVSEKVMSLYESDFRFAGFPDTKDLLFQLYPKYDKRVIKIIENCYMSDDKTLVERGGYCLTEMYILKEQFADVISNVEAMNEMQAKSIIHMSLLYFDKEEYNVLVKNILRKFISSSLEVEDQFSRIFYRKLVNLERDSEFLIEMMSSNVSRKLIHSFVYYLEKESKSLIRYKDIILSTSRYLIQNVYQKKEGVWGIEDNISKLIVGLYDETATSSLPESKKVAQECLDIWDMMFEKQIGSIRKLSQKIMEI